MESLEIYYLTNSFLSFICLPEDTFVLCFNWKYKPWKKYNVPEQNLPPKFWLSWVLFKLQKTSVLKKVLQFFFWWELKFTKFDLAVFKLFRKYPFQKLQTQFSQLPFDQFGKSQCPTDKDFPVIFKTLLTFNPSCILKEVIIN